MAKTNSERVNDFIRSRYDRLSINIPRGGKAALEREAKERGITVTALIAEAIKSYCGIDLRKD